jgi:hypothetical protein
MLQVKAFLESLDPRAWYLASAGIVWLVTWIWRRFLPGLWALATAKGPALTQLPVIVLGALISAAPAIGKPLWALVQETIVGAILSAVSAQGVHAALKALPVPYDGAQGRVDAAKAFRASSSERPTPPSGPIPGPYSGT